MCDFNVCTCTCGFITPAVCNRLSLGIARFIVFSCFCLVIIILFSFNTIIYYRIDYKVLLVLLVFMYMTCDLNLCPTCTTVTVACTYM